MQPPLDEATLPDVIHSAETLLGLVQHDPLDNKALNDALEEARLIVEMLDTLQRDQRVHALDHPYTRDEAEHDLERAKAHRFTNPQLIEAESAVGPVYAVSYQDHPTRWQSVGEIVTSHTPLEFRQNQHRTLSIDSGNRRR